jgi:hypothetical protein
LNLVAIVTRGFLLIIGYGWFTIDFVLWCGFIMNLF